MNRHQATLYQTKFVPTSNIDKCVSLSSNNIMDTDDVLSYCTSFQSSVAGMSLLVPMSPIFGEPLSLPVNHRMTDLSSLKDKTTKEVVQDGKKVVKEFCIADELYGHAKLDYFIMSGGVALHYLPARLIQREALTNEQIVNDDISDSVIQTWMNVDFPDLGATQKNLRVDNLAAVLPTTKDINILHLLLNIPVY